MANVLARQVWTKQTWYLPYESYILVRKTDIKPILVGITSCGRTPGAECRTWRPNLTLGLRQVFSEKESFSWKLRNEQEATKWRGRRWGERKRLLLRKTSHDKCVMNFLHSYLFNLSTSYLKLFFLIKINTHSLQGIWKILKDLERKITFLHNLTSQRQALFTPRRTEVLSDWLGTRALPKWSPLTKNLIILFPFWKITGGFSQSRSPSA